MQSQRWQNDLCFQGKPFNITVIQVYAPTSNAEEAEVEWFCEDLQDLLELTPSKNVLFIKGDWNAKVGSWETPGVTGKFGFGVQNEEGQRLLVLPRECTDHSKHPFPGTQEKTTYGHHQMVNTEIRLIYTLCSQTWRSSIQSTKTRLGADCDSDHKLLIAKFRLKLKKVGKTIRPFRYDLNQTPCDDTVEMRNRFKGIRSDRVSE